MAGVIDGLFGFLAWRVTWNHYFGTKHKIPPKIRRQEKLGLLLVVAFTFLLSIFMVVSAIEVMPALVVMALSFIAYVGFLGYNRTGVETEEHKANSVNQEIEKTLNMKSPAFNNTMEHFNFNLQGENSETIIIALWKKYITSFYDQDIKLKEMFVFHTLDRRDDLFRSMSILDASRRNFFHHIAALPILEGKSQEYREAIQKESANILSTVLRVCAGGRNAKDFKIAINVQDFSGNTPLMLAISAVIRSKKRAIENPNLPHYKSESSASSDQLDFVDQFLSREDVSLSIVNESTSEDVLCIAAVELSVSSGKSDPIILRKLLSAADQRERKIQVWFEDHLKISYIPFSYRLWNYFFPAKPIFSKKSVEGAITSLVEASKDTDEETGIADLMKYAKIHGYSLDISAALTHCFNENKHRLLKQLLMSCTESYNEKGNKPTKKYQSWGCFDLKSHILVRLSEEAIQRGAIESAMNVLSYFANEKIERLDDVDVDSLIQKLLWMSVKFDNGELLPAIGSAMKSPTLPVVLAINILKQNGIIIDRVQLEKRAIQLGVIGKTGTVQDLFSYITDLDGAKSDLEESRKEIKRLETLVVEEISDEYTDLKDTQIAFEERLKKITTLESLVKELEEAEKKLEDNFKEKKRLEDLLSGPEENKENLQKKIARNAIEVKYNQANIVTLKAKKQFEENQEKVDKLNARKQFIESLISSKNRYDSESINRELCLAFYQKFNISKELIGSDGKRNLRILLWALKNVLPRNVPKAEKMRMGNRVVRTLSSDSDVVRQLLQHSDTLDWASQYYVDEKNNNIFHLVAAFNHEFAYGSIHNYISYEQFLILVSQKNQSGETPLHILAKRGNIQLFKLMMELVHQNKKIKKQSLETTEEKTDREAANAAFELEARNTIQALIRIQNDSGQNFLDIIASHAYYSSFASILFGREDHEGPHGLRIGNISSDVRRQFGTISSSIVGCALPLDAPHGTKESSQTEQEREAQTLRDRLETVMVAMNHKELLNHVFSEYIEPTNSFELCSPLLLKAAITGGSYQIVNFILRRVPDSSRLITNIGSNTDLENALSGGSITGDFYTKEISTLIVTCRDNSIDPSKKIKLLNEAYHSMMCDEELLEIARVATAVDASDETIRESLKSLLDLFNHVPVDDIKGVAIRALLSFFNKYRSDNGSNVSMLGLLSMAFLLIKKIQLEGTPDEKRSLLSTRALSESYVSVLDLIKLDESLLEDQLHANELKIKSIIVWLIKKTLNDEVSLELESKVNQILQFYCASNDINFYLLALDSEKTELIEKVVISLSQDSRRSTDFSWHRVNQERIWKQLLTLGFEVQRSHDDIVNRLEENRGAVQDIKNKINWESDFAHDLLFTLICKMPKSKHTVLFTLHQILCDSNISIKDKLTAYQKIEGEPSMLQLFESVLQQNSVVGTDADGEDILKKTQDGLDDRTLFEVRRQLTGLDHLSRSSDGPFSREMHSYFSSVLRDWIQSGGIGTTHQGCILEQFRLYLDDHNEALSSHPARPKPLPSPKSKDWWSDILSFVLPEKPKTPVQAPKPTEDLLLSSMIYLLITDAGGPKVSVYQRELYRIAIEFKQELQDPSQSLVGSATSFRCSFDTFSKLLEAEKKRQEQLDPNSPLIDVEAMTSQPAIQTSLLSQRQPINTDNLSPGVDSACTSAGVSPFA